MISLEKESKWKLTKTYLRPRTNPIAPPIPEKSALSDVVAFSSLIVIASSAMCITVDINSQ